LRDQPSLAAPNARRVIAGRLNRMKRGRLTPEGRQRLREAALRNRPWDYATGPRTPAGKAQAAINGKNRQVGTRSVREIRAELATLKDLVGQMGRNRQRVAEALGASRKRGRRADC